MQYNKQINIFVENFVATVVLDRPPHNFVDVGLVTSLADCLDELDSDARCRVVILATEGKNFCAGADFSGVQAGNGFVDSHQLYRQAMRLFETRKPIVAAVQGAAVGAGAGLAIAADFRIVSTTSRFKFNFNRLGFHPGFGLSYTLPLLVGKQRAARLFYTGDPVSGEEAVAIGLADELAADGQVRTQALAFALQIAQSAPKAVESTREALRRGLAQKVRAFNELEMEFQKIQFQSADFREGVAAAAERRTPIFSGT